MHAARYQVPESLEHGEEALLFVQVWQHLACQLNDVRQPIVQEEEQRIAMARAMPVTRARRTTSCFERRRRNSLAMMGLSLLST